MEREFMDYKKMGIDLNQFMGSSSSIGAKRVTNVCVAFRVATQQNNRAGWVLFFYSIYSISIDYSLHYSCWKIYLWLWKIYFLFYLTVV
jgi:hypothetical protein